MLNLKTLSLKCAMPVLLALSALSVIAQNRVQAPIDSLHKKLALATEDTNKVNLFIKVGEAFLNPMKADSALFYYNRALELSGRLKWEKGIARADCLVGYAYYYIPDYGRCQDYSERSETLAYRIGDYQQAIEALNYLSAAIIKRKNVAAAVSYLQSFEERFINHRRQLAGLYILIGGCEEQRSAYPDAVDYFDKALALEKADHLRYIKGESLFAIAEFYRHLHYIKKAEAVLRKAVADFSQSKGEFGQYDLAYSYFELGVCADEALDRLSAIANYVKALNLAEKIRDASLSGDAENNIAWDYFLLKDYDKAYSHVIRSIALKRHNSSNFFYSLATLGSIYREAPMSVLRKAGIKPGEQYIRSAALLNEAISYRQKHNPRTDTENGDLYELSLTYEKMHRYADALKLYKTYIAQKNRVDSLTDGKAVELKEAQIAYSHREDSLRYKQNITNEQLKSKKQQSFFFIGGIGILLVLSGFIWVNYKNQRKSNKLLADANQQLGEQREEITSQRDQLADTITDLKSAQQQLIQSEKMASLGELTAGIAHEIQNPLNFVNNFSDVNREMLTELQEALDVGDIEEAKIIAGDLKQNEDKINHHGKRADGIVKGMLEHSRASTGQKELTDLNKLADEYIRLAYHGLRAKDKSFNAELLTNLDVKLPLVNIVPQDIGRVLLNLFNNSFYAVNQRQLTAGNNYKPAVEVATTVNDQQVQLTVKDNGTGIPDAIKDKIMQPFFTTKPTGQGTGLGLSLSYDIVIKGHNGNITVNSTPGECSEFIIQLPITK